MPQLLTEGETHRRRRLQRRLARQQRGSNRYARTKRPLARLSAREPDRRRDCVEKTTTTLVRSFGALIALEDLRVANMVRSAQGTRTNPGRNVAAKRGLNRAIHNQAWATLGRRLTDKAALVGTPLVVVNPHNTSIRCHQCGHTSAQNRKNQAVFSCRAWGLEANADHNAAINILAAGLAVTGHGGTPHASAQRPNETLTTQAAA